MGNGVVKCRDGGPSVDRPPNLLRLTVRQTYERKSWSEVGESWNSFSHRPSRSSGDDFS